MRPILALCVFGLAACPSPEDTQPPNVFDTAVADEGVTVRVDLTFAADFAVSPDGRVGGVAIEGQGVLPARFEVVLLDDGTRPGCRLGYLLDDAVVEIAPTSVELATSPLQTWLAEEGLSAGMDVRPGAYEATGQDPSCGLPDWLDAHELLLGEGFFVGVREEPTAEVVEAWTASVDDIPVAKLAGGVVQTPGDLFPADLRRLDAVATTVAAVDDEGQLVIDDQSAELTLLDASEALPGNRPEPGWYRLQLAEVFRFEAFVEP